MYHVLRDNILGPGAWLAVTLCQFASSESDYIASYFSKFYILNSKYIYYTCLNCINTLHTIYYSLRYDFLYYSVYIIYLRVLSSQV